MDQFPIPFFTWSPHSPSDYTFEIVVLLKLPTVPKKHGSTDKMTTTPRPLSKGNGKYKLSIGLQIVLQCKKKGMFDLGCSISSELSENVSLIKSNTYFRGRGRGQENNKWACKMCVTDQFKTDRKFLKLLQKDLPLYLKVAELSK